MLSAALMTQRRLFLLNAFVPGESCIEEEPFVQCVKNTALHRLSD